MSEQRRALQAGEFGGFEGAGGEILSIEIIYGYVWMQYGLSKKL